VVYVRWLFCLTVIALLLTGCNEKEGVNNDESGTDETHIIGEGGKDITVDDLKEGFKVDVWYTGPIMESYPAQATASKIKVIKENVDQAQSPCMAPEDEEVQGKAKFTIYYTCEDKLYPVHRFISDTEEISLQTVLEELLKGPTAEEQALGLHSWFSDETAGMLNDVTLEEDGTAIIDFANFSSIIPNASTSAGKRVLISELSTAVFKHSNVEHIVFQFNSSTEDYCHWMEVVCEPYSRTSWEEHVDLAD
jgi:spore germination protein GerM